MAVLLIEIPEQIPENHNSHPQGHGLHKPQHLAYLVIGHAADKKHGGAEKADTLCPGQPSANEIYAPGHCCVQQNIKGNKPSHMVSDHCHLQPGSQIIQESESGAAYRKHILEEALLPVAGPEIQVIHV